MEVGLMEEFFIN